MLKWYQQVVILLITCYSIKLETATIGLLPEGVQCVCAGDRLFYNCSVVGGTATRWKGSLLDCPLNEITLRHSQFGSNQAIETCNNGDISGYGIGSGAVNNNCYTSQLNVTVRANFNNKTVQCILNSNEGTTIIGESVLSVLSATNFYPPSENLSLADAQEGKLIFKWSSVRSNSYCNIPQYGITSDCGVCPTITNMTIATCSDLQLSTNAVTCHFQVSTYACNLIGNPSLAIAVTLKVPDVPQVKIVPSYSNDSKVLQKIFIVTTLNQTEDLFYISGGIIGSPVSYLVSGTSFNSTVDVSTCDSSGCPVKVPFCSTIINVTISAANKLGEGPPSNPFMTECTNTFVQVLYKETSSESTISCIFLNPSDTSGKTCCITYQSCDHEGTNAHECSDSFPYEIELEASDGSSQRYCYTITARNATHTVKVEGNFTLGHNRDSTAIIAAAVIVPFICILLLLGIMIGIALLFRTRSKQKPQYKYDYAYDSSPLVMKRYHLPSTVTLHKVQRNCKLQEYITEVLNVDFGFRRGHTYYEFINEKENILEGKEVLLEDKKNTKKWFKLAQPENVAAGRLKLYGEGIARSSFGDQYRVFIQSFGSGTRHLPRGSWILHNHCEDQVEPDVLPLVPIYSEYFCHKIINSEEECTVQEFCMQNRLNATAFNIFLTVEHLPKGMRDQPARDVILMNRVSGNLFTGPFARQMLNPRNGGEVQQNEKWKVFVLLRKNKQGLMLQKNSEVLYQDSRYMNGKYSVLEVDKDCVRMSEFIETKPDCQYEDGKAFYEAGKEEDLLYYKKILRPQKEQLGCEQLELQSLVEYFYAIDGVPANGVKLKDLSHSKIFIQSTSQGSRCLKKGDKLLYLKEYISSDDHGFQDDQEKTHSDSLSADGHRQ